MNLTEDERDALIELGEVIAHLGESVGPPMDPKIEALLEIIYSLIYEQIDLDKTYEYVGAATEDDKFSSIDPDIPDAKELESWMNPPETENNL